MCTAGSILGEQHISIHVDDIRHKDESGHYVYVYSCVNVQDQVIKVVITILKERAYSENASHTCKAHEQ